jgi:hypothetical protein
VRPAGVFGELTGTYRSFVESFSAYRNDAIAEWVSHRIDEGNLLWRDPYVTLRRTFAAGKSLADLAGIHHDVLGIFASFSPYSHQSDAIQRALSGRNVVVATGTGSGKSMSFFVPVVNEALRARDEGRSGIKAILIYPMNALANSQYETLSEILEGSGLTVANYTGDLKSDHEAALKDWKQLTGRDTPRDSEVIDRETLREQGADILMTNYVMLELALTRWEDRTLFPFEQMSGLDFLVLDEVHAHSGRQGADVACLIRRLKEHTGTSGQLRCMATSATVDDPVSGRAAIAEFAAALFGEPFDADDVVVEEHEEETDPVATLVASELLTPQRLYERAESELGIGVEEVNESLDALPVKLHGFFSQGRTVTMCARAPIDAPHLSDRGESTCGHCVDDGVEDVPAFPVVFCASCGQEYLVAANEANGVERLRPREFETFEEAERAVYVLPEPYDREESPPDPSDLKKDGSPRKGREGAVPQSVILCGRCGALNGSCSHDEDHEVALIARPFLFCPSCGVQHGAGREYNKFFQVGAVGRATATDVLLTKLLEELDPGEQQVIAFCDNRQDTSFQAAHVNAFHRRLHFRRALYAGLTDRGGEQDPKDAAWAALDAMKSAKAVPKYAVSTAVQIGKAASVGESVYARYLTFGALLEVSGYARRVQPSLSDAGALAVDYDGLDDLAVGDEWWKGVPVLCDRGADDRYDYARGVLDTIRRARALDHEAFIEGPRFRDEVVSRIADTAQFHDWGVPPNHPTVFSDELAQDTWGVTVRRFSWRSGTLSRWTRKFFNVDSHEAEEIIRAVVQLLRLPSVGLLVEAKLQKGGHGWVLPVGRLLLTAVSTPTGGRCPKCGSSHGFRETRPCIRCVKVDVKEHDYSRSFFWSEYTATLEERVPLEAAEHSAQVPGDDRRRAETDFSNKDKPLNVLVCTPTMELGIDIGQLSAVFMRNVPPSPANYAQRSGRAGRQRQSSVIATFCGAGGRRGPHDQYFYRFPEKMISGRIAAPRFLLDNQTLLRAHLHSLVFERLGMKVPPRASEILDLSKDQLPLFSDLRSDVESELKKHAAAIEDSARRAFAAEIAAFDWFDTEFVSRVVEAFADDFDLAWNGFRSDYANARDELKQLGQKGLSAKLDLEEERRRISLENRLDDMREGRSDFYTFRYLAAQGFLPNYAFPRRAASVFFNDRKEFMSRGRVTALRELAPGNSIYYGGSRYTVDRAQVRARGGASFWDKLKLCSCGAFLRGAEVDAAGACPACGNPLTGLPAFTRALELPDAIAARRGRVGADEEERIRRGYIVEPHFKMPLRARKGVLRGEGVEIPVTFGHEGRLLLVNEGMRAGDEKGFRFCTRCRLWNPGPDHFSPDKPCGEAEDSCVSKVVIFNEGLHDILLLDVAGTADAAVTLMHALRTGIQVAFGLDQSELGGFAFSQPTGRHLVLLYETDEGGIGILDQLGRGDGWKRLIERTLEILHIDPSSGTDDGDACVRACYDCLLTFYNQLDHDRLDRSLIKEMLLALRELEFEFSGDESRWDDIFAAADHSLEPDVLHRMHKLGLPAPDELHKVIKLNGDPIAEADLFYEPKIVVFIDGPKHDADYVGVADVEKRKKLKGRGYQIVVIRHDDVEAGVRELAERLNVSLS